MTKDGGPRVALGDEDGYRSNFERELSSLINRHSLEDDSNTPDFVIAAFLLDVLHSWNARVTRRDQLKRVTGRASVVHVLSDVFGVRDEDRLPWPHEATKEKLFAFLERHGWTEQKSGHGTGSWWSTWEPPAELNAHRPVGRVRVPLREDYDDYDRRLREAVEHVRWAHGEPENQEAEIRSLRTRLANVHTREFAELVAADIRKASGGRMKLSSSDSDFVTDVQGAIDKALLSGGR